MSNEIYLIVELDKNGNVIKVFDEYTERKYVFQVMKPEDKIN